MIAPGDVPFPELRTPRFLLRRIVASDAAAVYAGLSDSRVMVHYGVSYHSLEATQREMDWYEELFRSGSGIWWGICEPERREVLLGTCGLNEIVHEHRRAELGYWLFPDHWGTGAARECVAAVVAHAFDSMGLHRVGAEVDIDNLRSCRLLERLGFQFEGIRRGYELKDGVFLDLKYYARLSTDPPPSFGRT